MFKHILAYIKTPEKTLEFKEKYSLLSSIALIFCMAFLINIHTSIQYNWGASLFLLQGTLIDGTIILFLPIITYIVAHFFSSKANLSHILHLFSVSFLGYAFFLIFSSFAYLGLGGTALVWLWTLLSKVVFLAFIGWFIWVYTAGLKRMLHTSEKRTYIIFIAGVLLYTLFTFIVGYMFYFFNGLGA